MLVGTARTWDSENRLRSITKDGVTTNFYYDGGGNRVKKETGGQTTVYIKRTLIYHLNQGEREA